MASRFAFPYRIFPIRSYIIFSVPFLFCIGILYIVHLAFVQVGQSLSKIDSC